MTEKPGAFLFESDENIFGSLVALHIHCPLNSISGRFPINLRLEVDEYDLEVTPDPTLFARLSRQLLSKVDQKIPSIRLVVRLRHCRVRYWESGVRIVADTKYRSPIEIGKYNETSAETDKVTRQAAFGLGGSAEAGLSPKGAKAGANASGSARWNQGGFRQAEKKILAVQDLYEVEAIPNGWRVGDPVLGDPLKRGNCLDGPYFGRPSAAHRHTCEIEFEPGSNVGSLRFAVTVRDGIRVERRGGEEAPRNERVLAEEKMRERLAGIRAEREFASRHGSKDNELLLFSASCRCEKGDDLLHIPADHPLALSPPPLLVETTAQAKRRSPVRARKRDTGARS